MSKLKALIQKDPCLAFIAVYTLFLWFLPNQNQTGDAYGYAFSMESGQFLTSPHHLLYNWLGYGFANIFSGWAMWIMLKLNALFMGLSLWVFNRILNRSTDSKLALALTVFCAYCFASLRFAGLNETYVIPLFFSLLGSYLLLNQGKLRLILGFASLSLAVLFHQIHVFWFLAWALAYGLSNLKAFTSALLSGLGILLVYWLFALSNDQDLWYFLTEDVQNGLVVTSIGIEHFLFTAVNGVRTVVQVHGDLWVILSKYWVSWLLPFMLLTSVVLFFYFRRSARHLWNLDLHFRRASIIAFTLHFLFAIYSMGNAEFMLMLPFLAIFAFGKHLKFSHKSWVVLACGIGLWNIGFDTLPKTLFDYHKNLETRNWLMNKNAKYFVAQDRTEFTNYMDWKNACEEKEKSIEIWDIEKDASSLSSALDKKQKVYSNIHKYPSTFDRRAASKKYTFDNWYAKHAVLNKLHTWKGNIFITEIEYFIPVVSP